MRTVVAGVLLLTGCAGRGPSPALSVPAPEPGRVTAVARAGERVGGVEPITVAVTNGRPATIELDARQLYALTDDGTRLAPLPPAEAARQAGGRRLPGAVRGAAVGAASGTFLGAIGGVISGAIQGGMGAAVAVGSAVGAVVGAVAGALGGGTGRAPDVAGFTDRALPTTALGAGLSATGYVYYPAGRYAALELLLPGGEPTREPERVRIAVEPAP